MGCEAPCEKKCRLCEKGDGIAIRDIETALAKYGEQTKSGGVFRMKKKKTVAIFGSGLFPLFLAGELEKKAYPVTVFCEEENRDGFLRSAAPFLGEEAFAAELKRLKGMDIAFEFGCGITPDFLRNAGPALTCSARQRRRRSAYSPVPCAAGISWLTSLRSSLWAGAAALWPRLSARRRPR